MLILAANGYQTSGQVWAIQLGGSWAWSQLAPPGSLPWASESWTAIYDAARDRIVAFGSQTDVWALPLSGAPVWQQIFPEGTPPSQRSDQQAIYDPIRDRAVMFGGSGPDGIDYGGDMPPLFNDVWTLSLGDHPTWTQLFPTGEPPMGRVEHALVYDPVQDRMIVYGGLLAAYNNYLDDTWALSLGEDPTWVPISDSIYPSIGVGPGGDGHGPGVRLAATIDDPFRDRLLVFGGLGVELPTSEVWALPLSGTAVWTRLIPDGVIPGSNYGHGAIFDSHTDRMVVVGGFSTQIWSLQFRDQATPTLLSLVSADADAQSVRLKWYSASAVSANVYRRTEATAWLSVGSVTSDGTGFLRYQDSTVIPGTRYGYRLGINEGGPEVFAGEVWTVTTKPALALLGARPNPAPGGRLSVAFVLPTGDPATLDLIDVAGRQVSTREVGSLGPGQHVVDLADASRLPAGVYLIRLHHAQRTLVARAVVMR